MRDRRVVLWLLAGRRQGGVKLTPRRRVVALEVPVLDGVCEQPFEPLAAPAGGHGFFRPDRAQDCQHVCTGNAASGCVTKRSGMGGKSGRPLLDVGGVCEARQDEGQEVFVCIAPESHGLFGRGSR